MKLNKLLPLTLIPAATAAITMPIVSCGKELTFKFTPEIIKDDFDAGAATTLETQENRQIFKIDSEDKQTVTVHCDKPIKDKVSIEIDGLTFNQIEKRTYDLSGWVFDGADKKPEITLLPDTVSFTFQLKPTYIFTDGPAPTTSIKEYWEGTYDLTIKIGGQYKKYNNCKMHGAVVYQPI